MTMAVNRGSVLLRSEDGRSAAENLAAAALDCRPISGWTHNFYRYPARFSPQFAAAAIEHFSRPGDLILDPYMGGGTAAVEGMVAGRHVIGNDLNSLASFVAKAKTTPLKAAEAAAIRCWAEESIPHFGYRVPAIDLAEFIDAAKIRNLSLPRARFIKKAAAAALASIAELPSENAQRFAKCVLLRVCQWALDGRAQHTSLDAFRGKLATSSEQMLRAILLFAARANESGGKATICNVDATDLPTTGLFGTNKAKLIVTSPPYPGVHVLYHRWQVDGRRETPAPYWITGCSDGQGASFYNFGDRRQGAVDRYFEASLRTLRAIRSVTCDDGYIVQMVAFNRPTDQLPRYLENMSCAGFAEAAVVSDDRIWRDVPNRKWHAALRGRTHSAREVVLVHRAV